MNNRKAKPVKNFDEVHITNLDDDFEDFTFNSVDNKPQKVSNGFAGKKTSNPTNVFKQQTHSKPDNLKQQSDPKCENVTKPKDIHADSLKAVNNTDDYWKRDYKDPIANKDYVDPWTKYGYPKTGAKSSSSSQTSSPNNEKMKVNNSTQNQHSLTSDTSLQRTPLASPLKIHQSPSTTARGATTTPLNQRPPVSSVHITKSYKATPRVNKNEKGFGHDAQDMYIDDLEDF